jgi:hypothetical protein
MISSKAVLVLILLPFFTFAADETFPQPPELQRDVDFWTDIFTQYDNDEGVLHDNRNLANTTRKLIYTKCNRGPR